MVEYGGKSYSEVRKPHRWAIGHFPGCAFWYFITRTLQNMTVVILVNYHFLQLELHVERNPRKKVPIKPSLYVSNPIRRSWCRISVCKFSKFSLQLISLSSYQITLRSLLEICLELIIPTPWISRFPLLRETVEIIPTFIV